MVFKTGIISTPLLILGILLISVSSCPRNNPLDAESDENINLT
jgi:hypothetical protein